MSGKDGNGNTVLDWEWEWKRRHGNGREWKQLKSFPHTSSLDRVIVASLYDECRSVVA